MRTSTAVPHWSDFSHIFSIIIVYLLSILNSYGDFKEVQLIWWLSCHQTNTQLEFNLALIGPLNPTTAVRKSHSFSSDFFYLTSLQEISVWSWEQLIVFLLPITPRGSLGTRAAELVIITQWGLLSAAVNFPALARAKCIIGTVRLSGD